MAGKLRHITERDGRYHARMVVPEKLRTIIGKRELSAPLGSDRVLAQRRLPAVVASFQDRLDAARAKVHQASSPRLRQQRPRSLDAPEMARIHFAQSVAADAAFRNADPRFARFGFIDEDQVAALKAIIAGSATTQEIYRAIGVPLEYFRRRGSHAFIAGSPEWRELARSLARAEMEALRTAAARNDGEDDPTPPETLLAVPEAPSARETAPRVRDLFDGYRAELNAAGKARNSETRWAQIVDVMVSFLGHDRADRIKKRDVIRWKDKLLEAYSPKSVRDHFIATARSVFGWAVDNELVGDNPFAGVKVPLPRRSLGREKGYNDTEALAVLKAAKSYVPPSKREQPPMVAAKRWTPFLAAYTGARIGELTQLRVEDVQKRDGIDFIRITPDAGTVKSGVYRDVPLHPHLIELGFLKFVQSVKSGPLFYREGERRGKNLPSSVVADRVAKWVRSLGVAAASVQPNHGWRHRLKTQGRDLGLDPRVLDAIQGHAPRTAGESYGDVSLKAKKTAIANIAGYVA